MRVTLIIVLIVVRVCSGFDGHSSPAPIIAQPDSTFIGASLLPSISSACTCPARPSFRRASHRACLLLLLFIGGVESNPGPVQGQGQGQGQNVGAGIRGAVLNVRSAVNKAAQLHDVIATNDLDFIVLTETWIRADDPSAIKLDIAPTGYGVWHRHRSGGRKVKGGGLAIIYKQTFSVDLFKLPGVSFKSFEMLSVRILADKRRCNVFGVYRPPPAATSAFYDEFSDFCDRVMMLPGDNLVLGDFNCPGDDPSSVDKRLNELLTDRVFTQHVHEPTREHNLLDLIITTNDSLEVTSVKTMLTGFSDHVLLTFSLGVPRSYAELITRNYRDFRSFDTDSFIELMHKSRTWIDPPEGVDDYVDQLNLDVLASLDKLAPLKSKRLRQGARHAPEWSNVDIKNAKRNCRQLERRYRRTKAECDYVVYRKAARVVAKTTAAARSTFYREKVQAAVEDARGQWRLIDRLLHSRPILQRAGAVKALKLATSFSVHFTEKLDSIKRTISTHIAARIPSSSVTRTDARHLPAIGLQQFQPVTVEEVLNILRLPASAKSSPVDITPSRLLRLCPTLFSHLITTLANKSFTQASFPTAFKHSQITPLLKKPHLDSANPANYRPISNLPTIGKVIERLAQNRIRPHISSCTNFSPFQSAYRPGYSTETATLRISNDLLSAVDDGAATVLVALDLSSAFDCVSHSKLLRRLRDDFGISGCVLDWTASYLSGRTQRIAVEDAFSETTVSSAGVPQGSVLGPLLFTAYVAPIGRVIDEYGVSFHSYADDISLYISLGLDFAVQRIEKCTSAVSEWFIDNDMLLNPSKSEAMVTGTKCQRERVVSNNQIKVAGANVALCDSIKVVGLTYDNDLSFTRQVSEVVKNCNYHIKSLRHIRPLLDVDSAKTIACSLVGSRLDYCNSSLSGISQHNLNRLQRTQNTLARVVCRADRRSSPYALLKFLHWLPISQRIDYKIALTVFKARVGLMPNYISDLIVPYVPKRNLRSAGDNLLLVPASRTVTSARAFKIYGPTVWNNLPIELRQLFKTDLIASECAGPAVNMFKMRLKTFLCAAAFGS
jgi:Reverse transcriptase (RNA-dependent DNA polymerase)/Endonuclease/Exonuclease/phosphatase family